MTNVRVSMMLGLLYCGLGYAAFCSEGELAGKCFEDKIKPMAFAAAAAAVVLGISIILLAVALLCKAKRRHQTKVILYRKPYPDEHLRETKFNGGFESASYHVKRNFGRDSEMEPQYKVTRNSASKMAGQSYPYFYGENSPSRAEWQ